MAGIKVYHETGRSVAGCKGVPWPVMNTRGAWRGDEGAFVATDHHLVIND